MADEIDAPSPAKVKETFFQHFKLEVTALQAQMDRLASTNISGAERADTIKSCLSGIGRLTNEVKDASSFVPAYDQRACSNSIKALNEKLQEVRETAAPKPKFKFSGARKTTGSVGAVGSSDARQRGGREHQPGPFPPARGQIAGTSPGDPGDTLNGDPQTIPSVSISDLTAQYVYHPISKASTSSPASLTSLQRCVVDISHISSAYPSASLTLNSIQESLLICGNVTSAAHVTKVTHSVIVVACRQFRMHECDRCLVYLACASRPIIEDCKGIKFAPLPPIFAEKVSGDRTDLVVNQWDRVDDFKWLKAENSPNWSVLGAEERNGEEVWKNIVHHGSSRSVDEMLRVAGVLSM